MKKKLFFAFLLCLITPLVFAQDNMRIFPKEQGEIITGFKTASLPEEIKITVAYPDGYEKNTIERFPLVFLFDTKEYTIAELKEMFYPPKSKNPPAIVASFRFKNLNLTQEQFDLFTEEIFAFFELNYKTENSPEKRIILAKNSLALLALNSLNKEANYFFNLGMLLTNTTSLPVFNKALKKQSRIFCFAPQDNILRLQNLLTKGSLKPMQNFFFKIGEENSFGNFDLRYFLSASPEIKQIKTNLKKEILQETPFYLQIKTTYGFLDFFPEQPLHFAPPILAYEKETGILQVLLQEETKVKISGLFTDKKWAQKVKIIN